MAIDYDLEERVIERLYSKFRRSRPKQPGSLWSWMSGWYYKAAVEAIRSGAKEVPDPEISEIEGGYSLRFAHPHRDSVFEVDFVSYPRLGFRVKGLSGSNKEEVVREALVAWITGAAV